MIYSCMYIDNYSKLNKKPLIEILLDYKLLYITYIEI